MKVNGNFPIEKLGNSNTEKLKEWVQAGILEPHKRKFVNFLFFRIKNASPGLINEIARMANSGEITSWGRQFNEFVEAENSRLKELNRLQKSKELSEQDAKNLKSYSHNLEIDTHLPDLFRESKKNWGFITTMSFGYNGIKKVYPNPEKAFGEKKPGNNNPELNSIFKSGMYGKYISDFGNQGISGDVSKWKEIDLMIMVAHNLRYELTKRCGELILRLEKFNTEFLFCESGKKLYGNKKDNTEGKAIEPFGFRDGLSLVPIFKNKKREKIQVRRKGRREVILDPHCGSFLIFRKLEQNVDLFNQRVNELTQDLFFTGSSTSIKNPEFIEKRKFVEAQIFGRFKDGTPLEYSKNSLTDRKIELDKKKASCTTLLEKLHSSNDRNQIKSLQQRLKDLGKEIKIEEKEIQKLKEETEDFNYYWKDENTNIKIQTAFKKCPFHAHIVKSNPRTDDNIVDGKYKSLKMLRRRIARRGIPYQEIGEDGIKRVGLLFNSYQRDLQIQFVELKTEWINDKSFPEGQTGIDPIIGALQTSRLSNNYNGETYCWMRNWDNREEDHPAKFNFNGLVTFKGGKCLYTPSLIHLKKIREIWKSYYESLEKKDYKKIKLAKAIYDEVDDESFFRII
ncbi:MAG: hypothetical protein AAF694_11865 [Bacteroidota bacterium]